jgi:hypothetical protein
MTDGLKFLSMLISGMLSAAVVVGITSLTGNQYHGILALAFLVGMINERLSNAVNQLTRRTNALTRLTKE